MSGAGLVVAAVNAVWQSALLAALAGAALRSARASAAAHAAVWAVVLVVASTLVPLDLALAPHVAARADARSLDHARAHVAGPQRLSAIVPSVRDARYRIAAVVSSAAQRTAAPLLVGWALIAAYLLLRLLRSALAVQALKRDAVPLDDGPVASALQAMAGPVRGALVAASEHVGVPCAVGFAQPMVLLPRHFLERLEPEDLYAAVAHELAHLRRGDDLVALAQRAITAVFFFNPVLHLVGGRMNFYREAACDDRAVSSRASALRYAQCLATILERAAFARASAAPALMRGRPSVSARVERLLNWKEGSRSMGRTALLIALAVSVCALFFARVELPLLSTRSAPQADAERAPIALDDDEGTLLGALGSAGYRATADDAIALSNAGVEPDLIVAIRRSGIERPTIAELIELANAGVDEDLVIAAGRTLGASTTASDLVALQGAGIDAGDLSDLFSSELPDLSVSTIIALHNAGVDGDYIRHVAQLGHRLSAADVIRMHEAGVDV